jgi:hypothetical protein
VCKEFIELIIIVHVLFEMLATVLLEMLLVFERHVFAHTIAV